jgi:hypothetical protein
MIVLSYLKLTTREIYAASEHQTDLVRVFWARRTRLIASSASLHAIQFNIKLYRLAHRVKNVFYRIIFPKTSMRHDRML